jgi:putative transposase
MPRASRYLREGYTFHLTHRCHDRRFLLKFARDRDVYREWLRVAIKRYGVPVYGYCLTSNHVHLVVHVDDCERVGLLMHLAAGAFAQHLNRRKGFEGSVWEHPYQCTIIQDGQHLLRCLRYVDLNMVRAGVVTHPTQWRWCGYDELVGQRARYRLLDFDRLLESLGVSTLREYRLFQEQGIEDAIQRRELERQAVWTEALAVGNQQFVERVTGAYEARKKFVYSEASIATDLSTWTIHEESLPYNSFSGVKQNV